MYIDTHAHLYDERFAPDRDEMMKRCESAKIETVYLPNCDQHTIAPMLELEAAYPSVCKAMMGLHPCYVKADFEEELAIVFSHLVKRKFAAIGEIGLDYYWDKTFVREQEAAFRQQIEWALDYDLPIVIHSRDSTPACIAIVKELQNGKLKGIFHCYSGTLAEAKEIIEIGFLLGIGGVVTYKNSGLPEVVKQLPLSAMVLETDAPYLSPVPHRGKRNESSYIPNIADKIATLLEISVSEVAAVTTATAKALFKAY